jgi:hypothetical protein
LLSSVRAVKQGDDIWPGKQFTRNRPPSQQPGATARKRSAMNDEAFTYAYDFDASDAVLVRRAHGIFEALRRDRKRVIAKCPFMFSGAARQPE